MENKLEKTNVMRILDASKVPYKAYKFSDNVALSGVEAANVLHLDKNRVFKTLVTQGKSGKYYVFDIPVEKELDLKQAALAVNEKNVVMIKSKELLPLTGYIHGGCSPIGMKKPLKTTFDSSLNNYEYVVFSGGKVGYFVEVKVSDISKIISYQTANIATDKILEEDKTY